MFLYLEVVRLITYFQPTARVDSGMVSAIFVSRNLPNWLFDVGPGCDQRFDLPNIIPRKQGRERPWLHFAPDGRMCAPDEQATND